MERKDIKILHCSDIHIGASFKSLGLKAERRKAELKDTFFRFISECQKEKADLALISGDLFDDVSVSESTVNEIKSAFSRLKSRVIISPGNHDPFVPGCPYDGEWPENVIIFKTECIENFVLEDIGVRIWGGAFTGRYQHEALLEGIKTPDDNFIDICVIHGEISSDISGVYNPITTRDISLSGMDYIALGHIHKRTPVMKAGSSYYAYPGCIEGRGFDETGDKGYYIGTVSKGYCNLSYKRICRRINCDMTVDVSGCGGTESFADKIINEIKRIFGEGYPENLYRITLKGEIPENTVPILEDIETRLNGQVFYVEVRDDTYLDLSEESLSQGDDLKGIFIRRMKEKISSSVSEMEKETAKKALKVGIRAFSRDVKYSDYY